MPTYITTADVRRSSGAPTALISDADISSFIDNVEKEMEKWVNTKFTPTTRIDILDGNGTYRIFTRKNPLLSIRALTTNDNAETPANIRWYKQSGKVQLKGDADAGIFLAKEQDTKIQYLYGLLEETSTETTTSAVSTVGTSISLTVSSISGFADNDWCEIIGVDGNQEVFQISGDPAGSAIVADQLVKTHVSGSRLVKIDVPEYIKRYMEIEATIAVAINAIGSTYTFNTSYTIGELTVNKGEPYPQWREVIIRALNERKMRKDRIKIRPAIMVN